MAEFVATTEKEELGNLTFEWNISEFEEKMKTTKVGDSVKLDNINLGDTKWNFKVFPSGKSPLTKDALGIMCYSCNEAPVTAKVSFSVMCKLDLPWNSSISVYKKWEINYTFPALKNDTCSGYGLNNFLTHEKIKEHGSLLLNGKLMLSIKMTLMGEEKTTLKPKSPTANFNLVSLENQERLKVSEHLKDSWTHDNFSDVHIKCGGQTFYCHRMILAKRSQYFSSMLESGMLESEIRIIDLDYMDVEILKAILKFIYGGEISNLGENAVDLMKAAGMFIIEDLKSICEKYLVSNYMKLDNVIDVVVMAETHNADELKKAAMEMIVANNDHIVKQDGWKERLANSSKLLHIEIFEALAVNKAL